MKKLLTTICILMVGTSVCLGADTLSIAHKTSQLTIPLQRGCIECNIDAQMPLTGGKALGESLAQRLGMTVGKATGIKSMEKASGEIHMPALSDVESSFAKYMTNQIATQTRDAKAYNLTLDVTMMREYETAKLITFRIEVLYYGVDNKRHQLVDRVTLIKQTGKTLQWSDVVNKKQRARFCKAAAQSLNSFFGVMDFINLKNSLSNGQSLREDSFPLPENGVAITRDGFCMLYAPGEITGPERGQPMGTIRLQSVWSYLTPAAKKWFK